MGQRATAHRKFLTVGKLLSKNPKFNAEINPNFMKNLETKCMF